MVNRTTRILGGATAGVVAVGGLVAPATASADSFDYGSRGSIEVNSSNHSYPEKYSCIRTPFEIKVVSNRGDAWEVDYDIIKPNGSISTTGFDYGYASRSFTENPMMCDSSDPAGTYRIVGTVSFEDDSWSNPAEKVKFEDSFSISSPPPVVKPPVAKKKMKLEAWPSYGKRGLRQNSVSIDVNPNRKKYKVKIQKKYSKKLQKKRGKKWRTVRVVKTRGRLAERTVKVKKGRYRVVLPRQHGMKKVKSKSFRVSYKRFSEWRPESDRVR